MAPWKGDESGKGTDEFTKLRPQSSYWFRMGILRLTALVVLCAAVVADASEAANETSDDEDFQE